MSLVKNNNHTMARLKLRDSILHDHNLKNQIRSFVDNGAWYLPCHGNLGDGLIGLGTLDLFDYLGVSPPVYYPQNNNPVPDTNFIIVGGSGGWFEGQWEFFANVLRSYLERGGHALVLPSTFFGFETFLKRFSPQLVIFAREETSFRLLETIPELKNRIYLAPDLAFAIDFEKLSIKPSTSRSGDLKIFRQDTEAIERHWHRDNFDLSLLYTGPWGERTRCVSKLKPLLQLMSEFDTIKTDRLHMAIIGVMLGCNVQLSPGRYHKNKSIFDYSLHTFSSISFNDALESKGIPITTLKESNKLKRQNQSLRAETTQLKQENSTLKKRNKKLNRSIKNFSKSHSYQLWIRYKRLYTKPIIGKLLSASRRGTGWLLKRTRYWNSIQRGN